MASGGVGIFGCIRGLPHTLEVWLGGGDWIEGFLMFSATDTAFTFSITRNQFELFGIFLAFCLLLFVLLAISNNWRPISNFTARIPFLRNPKIPDWLRNIGAVVLASLLGLLAFDAFAALIGLSVSITHYLRGDEISKGAATGETLRGAAFALAAIVGFPFLAWRSWAAHRHTVIASAQWEIAHKQAETAEQGLITDRITKAVEQLGSKKIAVRLGAIYSLERILIDSPRDKISIMKTLNAYLKYHSVKSAGKRTSSKGIKKAPRIDIQGALDVLSKNR